MHNSDCKVCILGMEMAYLEFWYLGYSYTLGNILTTNQPHPDPSALPAPTVLFLEN